MFDAHFTEENLSRLFKHDIAPRGGRGLDRMSVSSFEAQEARQVEIISRKVTTGTYKFTPYLQRLVNRGPYRRPRLISIPTVRDRLALAALRDYLHRALPQLVNRRIPNARIRELATYLEEIPDSSLTQLQWQRLDISSFYPSLDHDKLLERVRTHDIDERAISLIGCAIRTPTVAPGPRSNTSRNTQGVPQGLAISNILAELMLHSIDKSVSERPAFYDRYADDFLIVSPENELARYVDIVKSLLKELGLSLNPTKFASGVMGNPFVFLGYKISGKKISPRDGALERYIRRLTHYFVKFKHEPAYGRARLLVDLNERITGAISERKQYGWVFYYLASSDLSVFYQADHIISGLTKRYVPSGLNELKSVAKAWHEAKYNRHGGYIFNYDDILEPSELATFLSRIGEMGEDERLTTSELMQRFRRIQRKRVAVLEEDIGLTS